MKNLSEGMSDGSRHSVRRVINLMSYSILSTYTLSNILRLDSKP